MSVVTQREGWAIILEGGGSSTPLPAALPPGKKHGTNYIGGWVSLLVGLERCGQKKFSSPHRSLNRKPYSTRPVAISTALWGPHYIQRIIILPVVTTTDIYKIQEIWRRLYWTRSLLTYCSSAEHRPACISINGMGLQPNKYGTRVK